MLRTIFVVLSLAALSPAQMTRDQKVADLVQLANVYAKNYAPYEWKRDLFGFDLLNLKPWLDRAAATRDDLDYLELLIEYVASLNDAHDQIAFPSTFSASLGFSLDIYDGRVLFDAITRSRLPASQYPFQVGDELVSVDGRTAEELIRELAKYTVWANPRSTARAAAQLITLRPQSLMPRAHEIGDTAAVVVRRMNGDVESYAIPWRKTGLPLAGVGPVLSPKAAGLARRTSHAAVSPLDETLPEYMRPLLPLLNERIPQSKHYSVRGFEALTPVFELPAGFVQRLGRGWEDEFFSGTYQADGLRLGFIRIPSYSPDSTTLALLQFEGEIAYFQEKSDGLIIEQMRNPGGLLSYAESLAQRVIPYRFRTLGSEIRATATWVEAFANSLASARSTGAPDWVVKLLEANLNDVLTAYWENRGRTGPLALNRWGSLTLEPATDRAGNVVAYSKPIMVVTDEFTASSAERFAAILQDNRRAVIFGMRTTGAGGSVSDYNGTSFSEGLTSVTESLMHRKEPIVTPEYPTAPYVENIGVHPDIVEDYMTQENLRNGGRTFVEAFTKAMVAHIRASR